MSEQNTDTPIADNNSVTNDSTKAETNDNNIPKSRLDEVVAQRHKLSEERDSLRAELDKIKANQEAQRKQELEMQGEYKTLLEEQGKELEDAKRDQAA